MKTKELVNILKAKLEHDAYISATGKIVIP